MKKRILSVLLCLVMVLGLLPTAALAAGTGSGTSGTDPIVVEEYHALKVAMESTSETRKFIKLGRDITFDRLQPGDVIHVQGSILLDLNGYTLKLTTTDAIVTTFMVVPKGCTLEIKDSASSEKGTIEFDNQGNIKDVVIGIDVEGALVVQSGTIRSSGDEYGYSYISYLIRNNGGACQISGGHIYNKDGYPKEAHRVSCALYDEPLETPNGMINISGGTFDGLVTLWANPIEDTGVFKKITGGTFNDSINISKYVDIKAPPVSIEGGIFKTNYKRYREYGVTPPSTYAPQFGGSGFWKGQEESFASMFPDDAMILLDYYSYSLGPTLSAQVGYETVLSGSDDAETLFATLYETEYQTITVYRGGLSDMKLTVGAGEPVDSQVSGAPVTVAPGTTTFTISATAAPALRELALNTGDGWKAGYDVIALLLKTANGKNELLGLDTDYTRAVTTDENGDPSIAFTLNEPAQNGDVYSVTVTLKAKGKNRGEIFWYQLGQTRYGFWTLTTELSKTLTGTVHYTSSAVYGKPISTNVTGLPTKLDSDTLTRQWQRSIDGGSTWTDISGATGNQYAPTKDDMGENVRLRVRMTADGWFGELVSARVTVSKAANNADPGIPALTAGKAEGSTDYTQFTIDNFDSAQKEYVYTATAPSGSGWPTGTEIEGATVTGLTPGTTYYVYARYKGTDTTEAGTVVRTSSVLLDDVTKLNKLILKDKDGNVYTDYGAGNTIYVKKSDSVTLNVSMNPSGANQWSAYTFGPASGSTDKYTVTDPTGGSVAANTNIGSITITGNESGSDSLVAKYSGYPPQYYGRWKVVVYENVSDIGFTNITINNKPAFPNVTMYTGETAAVPEYDELTTTPAGALENYVLEWRVMKSAAGVGGQPTYDTDNGYLKVTTGGIEALQNTAGADPKYQTVALCAVKGSLVYEIASYLVTVTDAPEIALTGLTVSPTKVYLDTTTNKAVPLTAAKTPVNAEGTLSWSSSDTSVATVDSTGKVTAVAKGETTITVSCGGKTATCTVLVDHEHSYSDTWTSGGDAGHYRTCKECDFVETAGHTWVYDETNSTPATMTKDGKAIYACFCGAIKVESIPMLEGISEVDVTVAAPVRGNTPENASADPTAAYYVADTQWEPTVSGGFAGGVKYAVKVALEARGNYRFTDGTSFKINGKDAVIVGSQPGADGTDYVILSYEFPATSSGGGGGGVSTYTVTVKDALHGSVTADRKTASSGATVTLTVKPDKGWTLETLTAANASGKELDLTIVKVGETYTFQMPSSNVTVNATFMEDNTILNYFVDVPTDSYYYDAVLWAVEQGITQGTDNSHFSPDGICTRAQAVTFLWRAAGSPAPKTTTMPFTDVPVGSYYYDAVLWAVENGITKGTTDTTFSPNMNCSRAQIVTFLWRSEKSPAAGTVNPFTDVKTDAYYADAVLWAVKEDVTKGTTSTTFSPDANCTRAQIVTFIWRCMK